MLLRTCLLIIILSASANSSSLFSTTTLFDYISSAAEQLGLSHYLRQEPRQNTTRRAAIAAAETRRRAVTFREDVSSIPVQHLVLPLVTSTLIDDKHKKPKCNKDKHSNNNQIVAQHAHMYAAKKKKRKTEKEEKQHLFTEESNTTELTSPNLSTFTTELPTIHEDLAYTTEENKTFMPDSNQQGTKELLVYYHKLVNQIKENLENLRGSNLVYVIQVICGSYQISINSYWNQYILSNKTTEQTEFNSFLKTTNDSLKEIIEELIIYQDYFYTLETPQLTEKQIIFASSKVTAEEVFSLSPLFANSINSYIDQFEILIEKIKEELDKDVDEDFSRRLKIKGGKIRIVFNGIKDAFFEKLAANPTTELTHVPNSDNTKVTNLENMSAELLKEFKPQFAQEYQKLYNIYKKIIAHKKDFQFYKEMHNAYKNKKTKKRKHRIQSTYYPWIGPFYATEQTYIPQIFLPYLPDFHVTEPANPADYSNQEYKPNLEDDSLPFPKELRDS